MSDKLLVVITIIIMMIIYPFYIYIMKKLRVKSNYNDKAVRAMRDGESVTAKVFSVRFVRGNYHATNEVGEKEVHPDSWITKYEYIVDGKKYKKTYLQEDSDVPQEITMYYFPKNPRKAYCESNSIYRSKRKIGCVTIFIWPTIIFVLLFHILRFILVGKL